MNAQELSALVAAAVSQTLSAVTGAETPIPEPELSKEAQEAQAARHASIEEDAKVVSGKLYEFLDSLGFQADFIGRLNASWGKDAQFTYNSTRAAWERAAERKAYWDNQQGEVALSRLRELEEQLSSMAAKIEQAEIVNRAAQFNVDKLFAAYDQEVLRHEVDPTRKANLEENFLKYNSVPQISEASYQKYLATAEAKYQKQQKENRSQAVKGEAFFRDTSRAFQMNAS